MGDGWGRASESDGKGASICLEFTVGAPGFVLVWPILDFDVIILMAHQPLFLLEYIPVGGRGVYCKVWGPGRGGFSLWLWSCTRTSRLAVCGVACGIFGGCFFFFFFSMPVER